MRYLEFVCCFFFCVALYTADAVSRELEHLHEPGAARDALGGRWRQAGGGGRERQSTPALLAAWPLVVPAGRRQARRSLHRRQVSSELPRRAQFSWKVRHDLICVCVCILLVHRPNLQLMSLKNLLCQGLVKLSTVNLYMHEYFAGTCARQWCLFVLDSYLQPLSIPCYHAWFQINSNGSVRQQSEAVHNRRTSTRAA